MNTIDYIGFDIHKKTISFCAKAQDGQIREEGTIAARRAELSKWAKARPRPWMGALDVKWLNGSRRRRVRGALQKLLLASWKIAVISLFFDLVSRQSACWRW